MKAKIRKTGEIVEVYHETQHDTPKMIYKESVLVNSRMWTEDELELLTDNEENERIRKALIDFFNKGAENGEQTNGVYDKDILAWLKSKTL